MVRTSVELVHVHKHHDHDVHATLSVKMDRSLRGHAYQRGRCVHGRQRCVRLGVIGLQCDNITLCI